MAIPKRVAERLSKQLRIFQRIVSEAQSRDVNEADTVTIVADMLAAVFGFDKYSEVTSEYAIRNTYCDLAVKVDGGIGYLVEVKRVGVELKADHARQAVDYGANHGVPWVVLTNGVDWKLYRIKFERPIRKELVCSFNLLDLNARSKADIESLYLLCKEGAAKGAMEEFHQHVQAVNRYAVAAILQSDGVISVVRRELKRITPGVKVSVDEIRDLMPDILKRDVLEGEKAAAAVRSLKSAAKRSLRAKRSKPKPAPSVPVSPNPESEHSGGAVPE